MAPRQSPIRVRPAASSDLDFLVQGNGRMAWETEHLRLDEARLRNGVAALLADPSKGFYLIAEIDGRPAGQMMITFEWSDWRNATFWWIQSVYVLEEFRQRGMFRSLYDYVESEARRRDELCGLRLYVETANRRAQETYRRVGMREADYRMFELDLVLHRGV